jgi:uncharacterized protein YjbI with pentapeptide repeats
LYESKLIEKKEKLIILEDAVLVGAVLVGANLIYAVLTDAHLQGAIYSEQTIWPNNFALAKTGENLQE